MGNIKIQPQTKWTGYLQWAVLLIALSPNPTWAQVTPDDTLGPETSTVDDGIVNGDPVQLIEGGAARGSNLFHSFSEFNVGLGEAVYFANPVNIENILSRVTGGDISNIEGLLGVDGSANLFLLNPNGVLFGPDAQLDIAGSLTVSTGDSFAFDEGEFSAIAPTVPGDSLLTISVPLGLQLDTLPQGDLINEADLAVGPGQTLTLHGNSVASTVRLAAPGGVAQVLGNQVTLIDSETPNISGLSGDTELLFQASDGIVVEDVLDNELLFANGTGQIVLTADADANGMGDVVMLDGQDVLQTNGRNLAVSGVNFVLGAIDTSVLAQSGEVNTAIINVEAGGAIPASETIGFTFNVPNGLGVISDLDVRFSAANLNNGVLSSADLISPDGTSASLFLLFADGGSVNFQDTVFNDEALVPIEEGSSPFEGSFRPENEDGLAVFDGQSSEGTWTLAVTEFDFFPGEGSGALFQADEDAPWGTAQGTQLLITSVTGGEGQGGTVELEALGDVSANEIITVGSGTNGQGGTVEIIAGGDIAASIIDTSSPRAQGGNIALSAEGNIQIGTPGIPPVEETLGLIRASGGEDGGSGGQVQIEAEENITLIGDVDTSTLSTLGDSGAGGNITIASNSGDVVVSGQLASSDSSIYSGASDGGDITISSNSGNIVVSGQLYADSTLFSSDSGNGGAITIASNSGNIAVSGQLYAAANSSGNSGDSEGITISSISGDVAINGQLDTSTAAGDGGAIAVYSGSGDVAIEGELETFTYVSNGKGGDITIASNSGDVAIEGDLTSIALSLIGIYPGNSGDGGTITISTLSGNIRMAGEITSFSYSAEGNAGRGGSIALSAPGGTIVGEEARIVAFAVSEADEGTTGEGGKVTLEAANAISGLEIFTLSSAGESGDIDIQGTSNSLDVSNLLLTTSGQIEVPDPLFPEDTIIIDLDNLGQSGNTLITSFGDITLNNVEIQADANGSQPAGEVTLESPGQVTFNSSQINSNANSTGRAGEVRIEANSLSLGAEDSITTSTTEVGRAGDIIFEISDALTIDGGTVESGTASGATGDGGIITVTAGETTLLNGGRIAVDSDGAGQGGDVILNGDSLTLTEGSRITAETASTDGGNLNFTLADTLLLRDGSTISTNAGTAEAGGDGGNISLTLPEGFIVAVPEENSDITANAFTGDGGNVDVTVNSLLGIAFRPQLTPLSDITASSEFGSSGLVNIDELNPDVPQNDLELPVDTAPPALAQGCQTPAAEVGSFVITGRGGLPTNPTDVLGTDGLWQDLAPLTEDSTEDDAENDTEDDGEDASSALPNVETFETGAIAADAAVVEAQNWARNGDGTVTLLAPNAEASDPFERPDRCDRTTKQGL